MLGSPAIVPFVGPSRLKVYPGEGLTGYYYVTYPEFEEMTFLERILRPGDVFYDIGANAGGMSVFAASCGAKVFAWEPVSAAYSRLEENRDLNSEILDIEIFQQALSSAAGPLRMSTELGTGNRVIGAEEGQAGEEIDSTTLDEVMERIEPPSFIKIDVEGHEHDVIRGGLSVLQSPTLVGLMIETFRPHNWQLASLRSMEQLLAAAGFLPFDFDPATNRLIPLSDGGDGGDNTLYLRDMKRISRRIR